MVRRAEILIITHAGRSIGGGHVGRCAALADAFASLGASVRWLVNEPAAGILAGRGVAAESMVVVENPFADGALHVIDAVAAIHPVLCVVDGYDATPALLEGVRRLCRVVMIDDCRSRPVEIECDAVLNYNLNAGSVGYRQGCAKLLLGPEYALLRRDFWDLSSEAGVDILIIPGASDLLDTSGRFVEWWGEGWPRAELVLGPLVAPSAVESLVKAAAGLSNLSLLHDPHDLPARMARSRAVLCTSSVASYEVLALRKPLVVFQTADNQVGIGREIGRRGLGFNLGEWGSWGREALRSALEDLPPSPPPTVNPRGAQSAAAELLRLIE